MAQAILNQAMSELEELEELFAHDLAPEPQEEPDLRNEELFEELFAHDEAPALEELEELFAPDLAPAPGPVALPRGLTWGSQAFFQAISARRWEQDKRTSPVEEQLASLSNAWDLKKNTK